MSKKLLISISAHEGELALADQCLNYICLGEVDGIILHVNANSDFNLNYFSKLICKISFIKEKIYINPYRTIIDQHSLSKTVVTSLHKAHISNFQYALMAGIDFDTIALDASNSLQIKPNLKKWINASVGNGVGQTEMPINWNWRDIVLSDNTLKNNVNLIRISAHEGSFYKKDVFDRIVKSIIFYEKEEQDSILSNLIRPEYPREEVLFPSFYHQHFVSEPLESTYISMPWHRNLTWDFEEVKKHIVDDFKDFGGNFGIKRVPRDINNPIRALVGTVYGYRKILIDALTHL